MSRRSRRHARQKKSFLFKFISTIFVILFAALAIGSTAAFGYIGQSLQDLPDYTAVDAFATPQKTKIYAADGYTLLAEFYLEDRDPVSLEQISTDLKNATIATEDERFYEHGAIDPSGIIRAVVVNLTSSRTEGASTITQQFVRNTLLLDEMNEGTIRRKIREAYLAMQVEEKYSKNEILNMYLNTINYGDGAYGVESAARHYYNKSASQLTLAESALIAGIPQSPTNNNPKTHPERALERRNLVLDRMLSNGYITQEQHDAAKAEDLNLNPAPEDNNNDGIYMYPYFTSWVRSLLLNQYTSEEVFSGGMSVYTTLDVAKQDAAEAACNAKAESLDDDVDLSLTSIDPDTGYVVALYGGRDYYTDQFNLATQASRQAGSCFKMFTLVAAIEDGISPQSRVSCSSPVTIGNWTVENYGGASYGTKTIAGATQISSNTAYARLIDIVGADAVVDVAHRLGITSALEAVPSITLGSQGVNTLQMASAYATLAAGGVYREPRFITKIENRNGNTIYEVTEKDLQGTQAITPEVAHATVEVLKTVVTSGTATKAALSGQVSAGKTGTSQNYRDSMYCGITPQLSTSVWIGAREERAVSDNMGGSNCCPVWKNYMTAALANSPSEEFPEASDPPYKSTPSGLTDGSASYESYTNENTNTNTNTDTNTTTTPEQSSENTTPGTDTTPSTDPTPTPDPDANSGGGGETG